VKIFSFLFFSFLSFFLSFFPILFCSFLCVCLESCIIAIELKYLWGWPENKYFKTWEQLLSHTT
jgi:hypothetical protein